jgi:hypothetical protein
MKRALGYTRVAVSEANAAVPQPCRLWIYGPWLDLIPGAGVWCVLLLLVTVMIGWSSVEFLPTAFSI